MTLPNLVIAGVTKAGTTSLYHYLGQHPDVGVADVKEVDHYAPMVQGDEPPSLDEYAAHFRACAASPWRLEASPRYFLGGSKLIARLAADLERPKVLIALREPVSRMWSSYAYKRSKGRLPSDMRFPQFVDACVDVAERRLERDVEHAAFRTAASGVYANYLGDWFAGLGDDVRVVFFDDLTAAPAETMTAICRWVGIDPEPMTALDFEARNATYQPRSRALRTAALKVNSRLTGSSPLARTLRAAYRTVNSGRLDEAMDDAQRSRLEAFYAPTLAPLRAMLTARGYVLPAWLTA